MENQMDWQIKRNDFSPERREFYESIFSLGNGYMGVRGFREEEERKHAHELCVYLAGVFDYFNPRLTDMVNTPNFWKTRIVVNGQRLHQGLRIIDEEQVLDLKQGVVSRRARLVADSGEETLFESSKFLSLSNIHQAVLSISLTPLNYDGQIDIDTGIDTDVSNRLVQDDQMLDDDDIRHFLVETSRQTPASGPVSVLLETRASKIALCEGFLARVYEDGREVASAMQHAQAGRYVHRAFSLKVRQGHRYTLDKRISVWTSRDIAAAELTDRVHQELILAGQNDLSEHFRAHAEEWSRKWTVSDIRIQGDPEAQIALRFNIYQLIQTCAEHDDKVNIGARGIMHSRYKGCYFWDTEIFMLPFYLLTNPGAARNLLLYRYHTLDGARRNAKNQNVSGARYPWMSALDGQEQCESWDIGLSEIHITADIAYAVNQYYEITGDRDFIRDYGLEMLIETARYWASRFTCDTRSGQYNLLFVKGPNEYGGVTLNNTFTVLMAIHNLQKARHWINEISKSDPDFYARLCNRLSFDTTELDIWQAIENQAVIPYLPEKNLYLEDELYLKSEPLAVRQLKEGDVPLYKKICFDRLQRYRVLKQADVILLMLLLPDRFSQQEMEAAWQEYEPITTHDSSLSFGTHAEMAATIGLSQAAQDYFARSVGVDLYDRMANTGREGLHFASMGASWLAVVKGFAGIRISSWPLDLRPFLPPNWQQLELCFQVQGEWIRLCVDHQTILLTRLSDSPRTLEFSVCGKPVTLVSQVTQSIAY